MGDRAVFLWIEQQLLGDDAGNYFTVRSSITFTKFDSQRLPITKTCSNLNTYTRRANGELTASQLKAVERCLDGRRDGSPGSMPALQGFAFLRMDKSVVQTQRQPDVEFSFYYSSLPIRASVSFDLRLSTKC
jgi:hypothetical protein